MAKNQVAAIFVAQHIETIVDIGSIYGFAWLKSSTHHHFAKYAIALGLDHAHFQLAIVEQNAIAFFETRVQVGVLDTDAIGG